MRFHCIFQPKAENYVQYIESCYGKFCIKECDTILVLGGDGFMLRTLHKYREAGKPFYGINFGSHGGLMNPRAKAEELEHHIQASSLFSFYPIEFTAETLRGNKIKGIAFNEVTIQRKNYVPIEMDITVGQKKILKDAFGDGVIISTPLGSRAYNFSAGGPFVDFALHCFIITPLNLFRPREWTSHVITPYAAIEVSLKKAGYRHAYLGVDTMHYTDIKKVSLSYSEQCVQVFFQLSLP